MIYSNFKLIPSSFLFIIIVVGSLQLVLIGCSQAPSKSKNSSPKISNNWREARPSDTPIVFSESDRIPTGSANEQILEEAIKALGESSRSGPHNGNRACAWMVNKILQRSVGYTVDGDATKDMNKIFQSHVASGRALLIPATEARPGDIIISPTVHSPRHIIGHVGIVGQNGKIMSNSSGSAQWEENYTAESWYRRYEQQKGLETFIYRITA